MMDLISGLLGGLGGQGIIAAIIGVVIAFFTGKVYLSGRKHAKAKADKQLKDAIDDHSQDVQAAADAGSRPDRGELRDDDGFRRD